MGTGKGVESFDIADVSEGCNYSDDILALTKKQSPNSMNVEFFNGRIRKRMGRLAVTSSASDQGGIDGYTTLMLHFNNNLTDAANIPKTVTSS